MPISRDFLVDDEEVLVDLRPHWIFLIGPLLVLAVAIAAAVAVAAEFPGAPVGVAWVLTAMVVVPALWLCGRVVRWLGISLVLTTARVVIRKGLLGRDLAQLRLQRITEVHCVQTPFERIVGTGRLILEVEGESEAIVVDDVRRPRSLQRILANRLGDISREVAGESPRYPASSVPSAPIIVPDPFVAPGDDTPAHGVTLRGGFPPPGSGAPPPSVPEQLIQLDDLRRRGIVTDAEFEAKKAELLGRL